MELKVRNLTVNSEIEVTRNTTQDFLEKDPPLLKNDGRCLSQEKIICTN